MLKISNWREGDAVSDIFLCRSKVIGKTKTGSRPPYDDVPLDSVLINEASRFEA